MSLDLISSVASSASVIALTVPLFKLISDYIFERKKHKILVDDKLLLKLDKARSQLILANKNYKSGKEMKKEIEELLSLLEQIEKKRRFLKPQLKLSDGSIIICSSNNNIRTDNVGIANSEGQAELIIAEEGGTQR